MAKFVRCILWHQLWAKIQCGILYMSRMWIMPRLSPHTVNRDWGFVHRNHSVCFPGEACHATLLPVHSSRCFSLSIHCLFLLSIYLLFWIFIKEMAHFLHLHAAKPSLLQNPDAPRKVCVIHCFLFGFCNRITDCIEFLLLAYRTLRCLSLYDC